MPDDIPRYRKRPPCATYGCGGCTLVLMLAAALLAVFYSAAGRYRPVIPPPWPMPSPNAFDDYVAAGQMLKAAGGTGNATDPGATAAMQAAVVANNQPALARLRQGLGKACQVPSGRSFAAVYPYLASERDLARLLALEQQFRAQRGDYAGVLDAGLDGMQMGQDMTQGGLLIHQLVGIAVEAIVQRRMVDAVDHLSAAECDRLARRMAGILASRRPASEIFLEERASTLTSLAHLKDVTELGLMQGGSGQPPPAAVRALSGIGWRFMRDSTLREVDAHYTLLAANADRPAAERRPMPEPKTVIGRILMPVFDGAGRKQDEALAHDRILLCMLLIRAYQLHHGRLPVGLADLGLDSRLVQDPCTGRPLVYRPQGSAYLLYSVGPDLRDDGGVPADEGADPARGDLGVRAFRSPGTGSQPSRSSYRRVPHMKPPRLSPGAPPLLR